MRPWEVYGLQQRCAGRVCVLLTCDYPQINLFLAMVSQGSDFFSCRGLPVNYPLVPEAPQPGPQPPGRAFSTASARRPGPLSPTCCALRAGAPGRGGSLPHPGRAESEKCFSHCSGSTAWVPVPASRGAGGERWSYWPGGYCAPTVTHPYFVNKSPGSLQERQAPCRASKAGEGGREGGDCCTSQRPQTPPLEPPAGSPVPLAGQRGPPGGRLCGC